MKRTYGEVILKLNSKINVKKTAFEMLTIQWSQDLNPNQRLFCYIIKDCLYFYRETFALISPLLFPSLFNNYFFKKRKKKSNWGVYPDVAFKGSVGLFLAFFSRYCVHPSSCHEGILSLSVWDWHRQTCWKTSVPSFCVVGVGGRSSAAKGRRKERTWAFAIGHTSISITPWFQSLLD